ncbi:adenylate/guanylate cyclase domain-containing protein [Hymenobacter lucidus]|uniref:Adenylate/guanylate cyclase domain-containing protein n=1 Tax=Hymenobacter lucidus TaxID=2880930 RepID=A0ABS8AZ20_9BACT|nr:adenylate/guanylate cyclase domain-containing protein [Hymenobacter lucidus]MCB2411028.1 adenylate/guanylate cyclase domain-containing protein [Hymenobacter lucidus]
MPSVLALPDNQQFTTLPDETILAADLRHGIPHVHACGGNARCSTCRVVVLEGLEHLTPRNEKETALATRLNLPESVRLACQTTVTEGTVRFRRPVIDELDVQLTWQELEQAGQQLGEEKRLAILFSDIENYTGFTEAMPAYDVIHVLNRYFELMGEVVRAHRGYISDFIGDGLMVVFGLENEATAATDAVAAAQAMLQAMERMNPYLRNMYGCSFRIRIGVHYGDVVVGHLGGAGLRKLATIGDAVNVAARIEAANKECGTNLLVSQAVVDEIGDTLAVRQGFLTPLKGKTGLHRLYEVDFSTEQVEPALVNGS